jgi:hypothetical protein
MFINNKQLNQKRFQILIVPTSEDLQNQSTSVKRIIMALNFYLEQAMKISSTNLGILSDCRYTKFV